MGLTKRRVIEELEKRRKWVHVECIYCGIKFPKSYLNYVSEIKEAIHYCDECHEKLFGLD